MALIVYQGPSSLPLDISEDRSVAAGKKFVGLVRLGYFRLPQHAMISLNFLYRPIKEPHGTSISRLTFIIYFKVSFLAI